MTACRSLLAGCFRAAAMICIFEATALAAADLDASQPSGQPAAVTTGEQRAGEIKLGWRDILALVERHPRLAAAGQKALAARAAVRAAGAVPNPSLGATTAYSVARESSDGHLEWGLALSVPLGWIAQRGAKVEAAESQASAADAEAKALRRDVLLQLGTLYWRLVYEQERVATLVELSEQTSALVATVKRRVEGGEVRPVEATRVELEAEQAAAELEAARSALAVRQAQLGAWLKLAVHQQLTATARLDQLPLPPSLPAERAKQQLGDHPAMAAARARVKALAASVSVERWARVPSLSLEAFTGHELDRRAYGVGLAVDLPLWNFNAGNLAQAEHLLAAEKKQLAAEQLELEAEAIESQAGCQTSVSLAQHYQERVLPRAASVTATSERTYQLGEASLLEVIDARRTLIETRRRSLGALVRAQLACCRLSVLLGEVQP